MISHHPSTDGPHQAPDLLLRPRDAARALAISERTLWELTRRGLIACVRIGRAVRYAPADLQAFAERQKTSGRPV